MAQAVCTGPDGQLLAVGVSEVDGSERGVVWRLDDDGAARVWTSAAGEDTVVDDCIDATGDGGTLLVGEVAGEPTAWTTADGVAFDVAPLGSLGSTFGRVRSVPGGFAAAGQTTEGDDAWTGGVVHLSPDGRAWRTLRLPAAVYTESVDVVAVGEDLLVAGDTDGGPQLWRLHDYSAQL